MSEHMNREVPKAPQAPEGIPTESQEEVDARIKELFTRPEEPHTASFTIHPEKDEPKEQSSDIDKKAEGKE